MKRTIRAARNREVHVEEIEDVLAFRGRERSDDGEAVAPERLPSLPQDARALRESGLRLVHSPRARWMERQRGRVLRAPGGDLLVASGEVVVGFRRDVPDSDALGLLAAFGARRAGRLARTFRIDTDSPFDAVDRLLGVPGVEYAEPVLLQRFEARNAPNDPRFNKQWQWERVEAEAAWKVTRGEGTRIAVLDYGFKPNHEDLPQGTLAAYYHAGDKAWKTDGNGPLHKHGTDCAGMAAARHGNQKGGCGIAPKAGLLLIAIPSFTSESVVVEALELATQQGAHVISMSVAPSFAILTGELDDALNALWDAADGEGVLLFFAVSNNSGKAVAADSIASHDRVVAVGSTDFDDEHAGHATGPELDLVAPGEGVYSATIIEDGSDSYGTLAGTSMATPCAAGVAALVRSANPNLTAEETLQVLLDNCEEVGGVVYDGNGHHNTYGHGRVNAARAVAAARSML